MPRICCKTTRFYLSDRVLFISIRQIFDHISAPENKVSETIIAVFCENFLKFSEIPWIEKTLLKMREIGTLLKTTFIWSKNAKFYFPIKIRQIFACRINFFWKIWIFLRFTFFFINSSKIADFHTFLSWVFVKIARFRTSNFSNSFWVWKLKFLCFQ